MHVPLLFLSFVGCSSAGLGSVVCIESYKLTADGKGCEPKERPCTPKCSADQSCEKGKCIERSPFRGNTGCLVSCEADEVCSEGKCKPLFPCTPSCQRGYECERGKCILKKKCTPPCSQSGYTCEHGECKKICLKECAKGTKCVGGVCIKPCQPKCKVGEFCSKDKCVAIKDSDKDGFKNTEDCDDEEKNIHPNATEICDGKDNNCDGKVDNIKMLACYSGPSSTLNVGICRGGTSVCEKGKRICSGETVPNKDTKGEVCINKKDDDCDGKIDNECIKNP